MKGKKMKGGIFTIWCALILVLFTTAGAASAADYKTVTAEELQAMLTQKDFYLLDVHIPEQKHIPGTDAFIDYRKIKQNIRQLPADKSARIVVYCLGGGMSRKAAYDLIDLGYTQVYDLLGGTWAFRRLPNR